MGTILSVYSTKAFREFLLPAINNAENAIILDKDIFSLDTDIQLRMEVIENRWYFLPSGNSYTIEYTISHETYKGAPLESGDLLTAVLSGQEHISLMVDETEDSFKPFEKYDICGTGEITVGSDGENDIIYNSRNLVSRKHALLRQSGSYCILEDRSRNGVFVNARRVVGSRQLEFGDCVNIYGLSMVYLGNILAVNAQHGNVHVNQSKLKRHDDDGERGSTPSAPRQGKILYHRSPRQTDRLDEDIVEIEAPPQPRISGQKPLGMLIGPSMTMALPMLLGCGLAIYSTRASGGSGSAFMYTGLITAVSSAMIGAVWTFLNWKAEKKSSREEEQHRFEAYGAYLEKRSHQIREKYEKNRAILNDMYHSAEECCGFHAGNAHLWNRNVNHEDFLSHRLGIGSMPFQVTIQIPKEKFTLINDSLAEKPAMIRKSFQELTGVPACLDLQEHRLVGIVGGNRKKGAIDIMHSLVAQLAVSNCYTDVKLAFIYDEGRDDGHDWEYMKWLPHVWSEDKKIRYVAGNAVEAGDILYEMTQALRTRAENRGQGAFRNDRLPLPQFVLFLSDPKFLEGELITKYITDQNNQDMTVVFLTDNYENLPNECRYIIQNDEAFQGLYDVGEGAGSRKAVSFDRISNIQMEQLARTLANIEVYETESGGDIPGALTFFDMHGVSRLEELNVLDKWRKNRTYDSMKALIGQKAGGKSWYLDIHEKYHGPHGLIAGTTGSGKSETLQTYILSLAINFSPDDVGFFLIDYKGGGMANLFDGLPHMIGQISNLSGNQVKRAMVSIKSENKRRQRIFNEHGVNNINSYTRLYKHNEASVPVPHMFIVIDEFAELKREEPEFMRELISVAQVGRSLGVHLILATQKPAGTVDDNIWSNSKFRLCLRVQDRQDSNDMLHRPDAAYITQAGRCYMQVGNDELFELFQSGFSGAAYDGEAGSLKSDIAHMLSITGKTALVGNRQKQKQTALARRNWIEELLQAVLEIPIPEGCTYRSVLDDSRMLERYMERVFAGFAKRNIELPPSAYNMQRIRDLIASFATVQENSGGAPVQPDVLSQASPGAECDTGRLAEQILQCAELHRYKLPERKQKTQLDAVVEYLAKLAKHNGFTHNMQLWLPVLPQTLLFWQLPSYQKEDYFDGKCWPGTRGEWNLEVAVGLYDDPVNQRQDTLTVNLSRDGHHAVVGTVVSGKSTFLQTLAYGLVSRYTPDEINIYAIDFSAKMMSAFEKMPHVGGVMYENDDEKLAKFFHMLNVISEERKQIFKGGNYSQYVRAHGVTVPSVIILIDNYSNFKSKTNNLYEDMILQLSREGVGYGIFLVIAAGGFGMLEIPNRIGDNLRTVICLEMNDKFQYAESMRTMHIDTLPEVNVKGRGLAKVGGELLEFQTALCFESEDDFQRMARMERLAEEMRAKWGKRGARAIPEIPAKPVWAEFAKLEETEKMAAGDRYLPVGYHTRNAAVYGIDLSKVYCYLITGKERSGKTNMLKAMIRSARMRGGEICLIDYKGDLAGMAEQEQLPVIDTDDGLFRFFEALLPEFKERNEKKHENIKAGMSDDEIYLNMRSYQAKFLFVADLADFVNHVQHPVDAGSARGFVENILDRGILHNVFWAACYNPEDVAKVAGTKIFEYFTRQKTGIHFGGNPARVQSIMNFGYMTSKDAARPQKPGIGMVSSGDEEDMGMVVIPLLKG